MGKGGGGGFNRGGKPSWVVPVPKGKAPEGGTNKVMRTTPRRGTQGNKEVQSCREQEELRSSRRGRENKKKTHRLQPDSLPDA